ncbi:hypothetical protein N7491_010345 [Penicillium cf. griseofulvum]|nr:hypothetical protein N7491_010345 [Penicillium cf. griseofulvum]
MLWDETLKITRAEDSEEFKLLGALVNGDVTVDDAVQWIMSMTMDRLESYGPGGTIERADELTFIALIELAMQIDTTQYGPLVEFLGELKLYNAVHSSTGLILKTQDGSRVWSHLPSLTFWARKIWTDHIQYLDDPDMELDQRNRWAKLNIFLAQLTQAADVEYKSPLQAWISDAMDLSHMGLCGLRHVFEDGIPSEQVASTAGLPGVCPLANLCR